MLPVMKGSFGIVLLICVGCSSTRERPPQPPVAPPIPSASPYEQALGDAEARAYVGDHAGALLAYRRALAIRDADAVSLTGAAWALLGLRDWDAALATIEQAIASTGDPAIKAEALYRYGRILEVHQRHDEARAAYQQAVAENDNSAAAHRLYQLDEPLAPFELPGPFASLAAYCAVINGLSDAPEANRGGWDMHRWRLRYSLEVKCEIDSELDELAAPYHEVVFFTTTDPPRDPPPGFSEEDFENLGEGAGPGVRGNIGIRTERGWYVAWDIYTIVGEGEGSETSIEDWSLVPQTDAPPVVRLVYHREVSGHTVDYGETEMVLCGVGPSGTASCTQQIPLQYRSVRAPNYEDEDYSDRTEEHEVAAILGLDGVLTVTGDPLTTDDEQAVVGRHVLRFY